MFVLHPRRTFRIRGHSRASGTRLVPSTVGVSPLSPLRGPGPVLLHFRRRRARSARRRTATRPAPRGHSGVASAIFDGAPSFRADPAPVTAPAVRPSLCPGHFPDPFVALKPLFLLPAKPPFTAVPGAAFPALMGEDRRCDGSVCVARSAAASRLPCTTYSVGSRPNRSA